MHARLRERGGDFCCPTLTSVPTVLPLSPCCCSARRPKMQIGPSCTLCNAAERSEQRGHTPPPHPPYPLPPPGPELRRRSVPQTVACARRRKLQVFAEPRKGSTSLLYDRTSPISDGIRFTPPEGGGRFNPRPGQPTLATTPKIKPAVGCCLNHIFSQYTVPAAVLCRGFHPYLLTVALLFLPVVLLEFGAVAADSVPAPSAARGCAEAGRTDRIQPPTVCIRAALASPDRSPFLCRCRLLLLPDNSSTASRLTLRLRALSGPPCAACRAHARAAQGLLGL